MKNTENATSCAPSRHGIEIANIDASADPRKDFYIYAGGGWMKSHPRPENFASYGRFTEISEQSRKDIRELLKMMKDDPKSKIKGTIAQKICDIYELMMDEDRIEREGITPLLPILEEIKGITPDALAEFLGRKNIGIGNPFVRLGIQRRYDDSDRKIMVFIPGGLGLGEREYYLEDSEENRRIMEAYRKYLTTICRLAGFAEEDALRMTECNIRFETEMARHQYSKEEERMPEKRNNNTSIADFRNRYDKFDWETFITASGFRIPETVNILDPGYMEFIDSYLASVTQQDLTDLMLISEIDGAVGCLGKDFTDASFELYGRVMAGVTEQQPRWKKAVGMTTSMFPDAVGQLYVEKHFPESSKMGAIRLTENIREALRQHILSSSWMSDATKAKACDKLSTLRLKIGYPDKWDDYDVVTVDNSKSLLENIREASIALTLKTFREIDDPVDKEKWLMASYNVNAYYASSSNEICFPAGILQPPYYDPEADDAVNYGAIGVIIGHEMTHGYDDAGRKYDKNGNFVDWWMPEDAKKFEELSDRLTEQFNKVEILPGVFANGKYTLGENIADQGGLRIALTAYLNSLGGKEPEVIDGYSGLQRFYLSYAGVWAQNITEEATRLSVKENCHSLGRERVNETLRNISEFFEAFGIREGDPLFRPENERVVIW